MILFKIALRNVFRHRTRSWITLFAIAFGCVALIFVGGFFDDALNSKMREAHIKTHTGHIQIYREGFLEKGSSRPFEYLMDHPERIASLVLQRVEGVEYVTGRIQFAALISTGETTASCIGQGIQPQNEPTLVLSDLREYREGKKGLPKMTGSIIESGEPLQESDTFSVLLGKGLASSLGVRPGDGLILVANTVGGSMNALDVTVKGTFTTASKDFDDHFLRLPLKTAQKLLHTEAIQSLVILLRGTEETDRVKAQLERLLRERNLSLELRSWDELTDFYAKTKQLFGRFFLVFNLVVAVIVILSIFNTMNMAVLERTSEIGTLMALGTKRRGVVSLFLWEGFFLGVFGGLGGIFLGFLLTSLVAWVGIPMPPAPGATVPWLSQPRIVPSTLLLAFLLSLVTSLISSLYPAHKASRLEIAQALRHAG